MRVPVKKSILDTIIEETMGEMEELEEMEEIEDETKDIEEEIDYPSDFDELSDTELSDEAADQPEARQMKRETKATFEVNGEDLKRNQDKTEETLKQEREEREACSKPLKQETVQTVGLQAETENMKAPKAEKSILDVIIEETMEEMENETKDIEEEIDYPSDFDEISDTEMSDEAADQPEAVQMKRETKDTFEVNGKDLKRNQDKTEETLKQEREEREALSKTLKQETVQTVGLQAETEHMKAPKADHKSSEVEHQNSNQLNKFGDDLKDNKQEIVELKTEPSDDLHELKQEVFQDNITNLQSDVEAKSKPISSLKKKDKQRATDLKKEQKELSKLLRVYDAAICQSRNKEAVDHLTHENKLASRNKKLHGKLEETQQIAHKLAISQGPQEEDELTHLTWNNRHLTSENKRLYDKLQASISQEKKETDKMDQLTHENHRLASENRRLQGELDEALHERQLSHEASISQEKKETDKMDQLKMQQLDSENKRLQHELEDSLHERQLSQRQQQEDREACCRLKEEVEKVWFSRACKKIAILKKASADDMMMQTLKMQNSDITAKFEAIEAKYDLKFKDIAHSQHHGEIMSQKDIISKNLASIAKLQLMVDDFRVQLSESRTRRAQLEDALNQEKTQRAVLEERASHTASALEKERKRSIKIASAIKKRRASSKKYSVERKEALIKQEKTSQNWQRLTKDLQAAQNNLCQVQEQGNLRHANDIELRLDALDELTNIIQSAKETVLENVNTHTKCIIYFNRQ